MLFELHDILLHRMWKIARDQRVRLIHEFLALKYPTPNQYRHYNRGYTFWSKIIVTTREWYLNHKRRDTRPFSLWA